MINNTIQNEIEHEYAQFLQDIKNPEFVFGKYFDEDEYEDEYCHNDIDDAMAILQEKIIAYLHKHRPNEFLIGSGWYIHVMTSERARQSRFSEETINDLLVG